MFILHIVTVRWDLLLLIGCQEGRSYIQYSNKPRKSRRQRGGKARVEIWIHESDLLQMNAQSNFLLRL